MRLESEEVRNVQVVVVRPDELGAADLATWTELQSRDESLDSPFLSPQFAKAVGRVRSGTRVAVLSDTTGIVGFFPFERTRGRRGVALAKGLSDTQGLVTPTTVDLDLGDLLRICDLELLEFDHLLGTQEKWVTSLPSRLTRERSPALDLRDGFDAYVQQRQATSKSLVQSTARKRRKLEREHGPVRLVFDEPRHDLLDEVLSQKSHQYRRTGRRDRFADPGNRALVHDLLDVRAPTFGAPLTVLYAGDSMVAAHLGLRSRTTMAWWFPVYDQRFAAYSPGLVMCLDLARHMVDENLSLLDLGRGDESYKDRLSNTEIGLLSGSVAQRRTSQAMHTARRWPGERVEKMVLGSPRLRAFARSTLAQAGQLRERLGGAE